MVLFRGMEEIIGMSDCIAKNPKPLSLFVTVIMCVVTACSGTNGFYSEKEDITTASTGAVESGKNVAVIESMLFPNLDTSDWVRNLPTLDDVPNLENNDYPNWLKEARKIDKDPDKINEEIPIPLEQAIEIGYFAASEYYDDLKLVSIITWDRDDNLDHTKGITGARVFWNLRFANKDASTVNSNIDAKMVDLGINSGAVYRLEATEGLSNNGIINFADINITAKEAVQKAMERGLAPANTKTDPNGWTNGFVFDMSVGALMSDPNNRIPMLDVLGVHETTRNFSRITFDVRTGEIILAEENFGEDEETGQLMWRVWD